MSWRVLLSQLAGLIVCFIATFATAAVGIVASVSAPRFYAQLVQPSWAPPTWLFGPVWTFLYALMAVSAWLVWRKPGPKWGALGLFVAQLVANALWSWLFFAWRLGALATLEILVLLGLIVLTARAFARTSKVAAWLLLPYALWVSFASALTWTLWRGNPGLL